MEASIAACPRHPDQRSLDACHRCGDYLCLKCADYQGGQAYCLRCAPSAPLPLAQLGSRWLGSVIDGTTFLLVPCLVALLFPGALLGQVLTALCALGVVVGNCVLLARQGQTLGKLIAGTRTVTLDDQAIGVGRMLGRAGSQVILGLPYINTVDAAFIFGPTRRTLHDRIAGTRVVQASASKHVYGASPRGLSSEP